MKFLKSDELEVGKCYQECNEGKVPYNIVTDGRIRIKFWKHSYGIFTGTYSDDYYVEISTHSFNRLKRYVLAKLDC